MWAAVYAIAGYAGQIHRVDKPFTPMLGETFEWMAADGGCRFLAEQVSGGWK